MNAVHLIEREAVNLRVPVFIIFSFFFSFHFFFRCFYLYLDSALLVLLSSIYSLKIGCTLNGCSGGYAVDWPPPIGYAATGVIGEGMKNTNKKKKKKQKSR